MFTYKAWKVTKGSKVMEKGEKLGVVENPPYGQVEPPSTEFPLVETILTNGT
jgi:hypothetical protein